MKTMRTIIIGDPHINEKAIPELDSIFTEILKQEGTTLIMLGDYYDNKRPTAQEIFFGTKWAFAFKKKFKKVIFLRGNHDKTKDTSAIDYLQYFKIKIVDEYIDKDNNYYGHFMTNKSLYEYGTYQKTIKQLRKYNRVILGHQHTFQKLDEGMYHLGSVRYVAFNEVNDEDKFIQYVEDGKWGRIRLHSPIRMADVYSLEQLTKNDYEHMKIRLVIKNFSDFKNWINEISKIKHRYPEFKIKLDFSNTTSQKQPLPKTVKRKRLQEILREGIAKIEDIDVKNLLQEQLEELK